MYTVCIHVGGTHMKVRRQLSGVGSLHFYVGSWDPTQATRLTQQVPLLLHRSVFVILTQTWTYLRRENYNWETVLIRLASRQACGAFSWLMVNVARSGSSWAVPPWGGWFWAVLKRKLSKPSGQASQQHSSVASAFILSPSSCPDCPTWWTLA